MRFRTVMVSLSLLASACASTEVGEDIRPGERPSMNTAEAGLWMRMDEQEKSLATSAIVAKDPELQAYLEDVVCRLAPEHCADVRIYIVKIPYFNASMAPNGVMQVWTGMLLRVENEAQLATVLGHELGHYQKRHSIKQWNSAKNATDFLAFFSIATGGVGLGIVGLAATVGGIGSIQAYSRDLETEADEVGQDSLHIAGYNPVEAANLWEKVAAENEAGDQPDTALFFATHPPSERRVAYLKERAAEFSPRATTEVAPDTSDRLAALVATRWQGWMQGLIETRSFGESLYILDTLEERGFDQAAVNFQRGEVYRRRSEEGDLKLAREAYLKAAGSPTAPMKTYKNLGLVAKRMKQNDEAIEYFKIYLKRYPDVSDRTLVLAYLKQLRQL